MPRQHPSHGVPAMCAEVERSTGGQCRVSVHCVFGTAQLVAHRCQIQPPPAETGPGNERWLSSPPGHRGRPGPGCRAKAQSRAGAGGAGSPLAAEVKGLTAWIATNVIQPHLGGNTVCPPCPSTARRMPFASADLSAAEVLRDGAPATGHLPAERAGLAGVPGALGGATAVAC